MSWTALLAFALAAPVGWLVWSRLPGGHDELEEYLESGFAAVLCAVFVTGFFALFLAEIGMLRPWALAVCLACSGAVLWPLRQRRPRGRPPSRREMGAVVFVGALACVTLAPGSEDLLGGRDPGVYANVAAALARDGTLRINAEGLTTLADETRPAFHRQYLYIPGLYITNAARGETAPQFLHLHPVYMALGFWAGGPTASFLVPPFLGVLAELAVFFFVRRLLGVGPAVVASAILAVNLAQIWGLRNPYSESATQLGVFGTLWSLARGYATRGARWGVLAALSLGACMLVRIDSVVLLAALIPAMVLLQAHSAREHRWATRAFLPLALLFALWSGLHGWFFTRFYVISLSSHLLKVWTLTLGEVLFAVGALVVRERARSTMAMVYRQGRWLWAGAALALCAAFVFGMWVRPALEPFTTIRGGRIRTYNEETLIRVAWYVSVPGMIAALAGVVLLLRRWLKDRASEWIPFLAVFLAFSLLYFWNQRIHPDHPWAMRRFLPVVIPGICIGIAALTSWLWIRRGRWSWLPRIAAASTLSVVLAHELSMAAPFWRHREFAGLVKHLEEFAARIPEDSIVLFSYRGTEQRIGLPLALQWGRVVLPVARIASDADGEQRRHLFERQVSAWLSEGREVLYLTASDGHLVFVTPTLRWEPVTTLQLEAPTIGSRYEHAPRGPAIYRESFQLLRAARASSDPLLPCAPLTLRIGGQLAGTGQGFHDAERDGRFRWAMPDSRLLLPSCNRSDAGRPHAVRVHAACGPGFPGRRCPVDVMINGQRAGTIELLPRFAEYEVPVPADSVAEPTGNIDIRFHGPLDPSVSNGATERSFLLARVTLLGVQGAERATMRHLFRPELRPPDLNLISDVAAVVWGVARRGFHSTERDRGGAFRWTDGRGSLTVPLDGQRPSAVYLKLARSSRPDHPIRITGNGCLLFRGAVPHRDWEVTLPLEGCPVEGSHLELAIESEVVRLPSDRRDLGVAVRDILIK